MGVRRPSRRRRDDRPENNLLIDLAAKRSLADDAKIVWAPGAGDLIVESVNHTRGLVRDARLTLLPRSKYLAPLRRMACACAIFMEQTGYHDNGPRKADLTELGQALRAEPEAIQRIKPERIVSDLPGDFALSREIDRRRAGSSSAEDDTPATG